MSSWYRSTDPYSDSRDEYRGSKSVINNMDKMQLQIVFSKMRSLAVLKAVA